MVRIKAQNPHRPRFCGIIRLPGMTLLVLKLLLTPLLIALASFVSRRWGQSVGGWVAGLPLTSGPVSVFLALEQGHAFAAAAAVGTLWGLLGVGTFCLAYAHSARRLPWFVSTAIALAAFGITIRLLRDVYAGPVATFLSVLGVLAFVLLAMPSPRPSTFAATRRRPLAWDVPLRMLAATTMVLVLTGSAKVLGPDLSGLVSPFPVFATVLAAFTHSQDGADAAIRLLRGVVIGSFAFATFFVIVNRLLAENGIFPAYSAAAVGAIAVNGTTLWIMRLRALASNHKRAT